MADRFIGIENEFKSFKEGKHVDFEDYFTRFINKRDYNKSGRAIRTRTGHGYYVDYCELELVTPPVALNKGFSTRLTDLLLIGRERIARRRFGLEHTGYSMHWNLSRYKGNSVVDRREDWNTFWEGLVIPFHLFGLTPISTGLKMRVKASPDRYEFLGDHISSEDQLNATALLLGAYAFSVEKAGRTPLIPVSKRSKVWKGLPNFLYQGRQTPVLTYIPDAHFKGKITAQQYLELFYHWIEPFVKALGSKREVANIEEHIHGTKQLEFDLKEYYAIIRKNNWKAWGTYLPQCPAYDKTFPGPVLRSTGKKRELPLEGELLGAITKKQKNNIYFFTWERLLSTDGASINVSGTTQLFKYASALSDDLPPFRHSRSPRKIEPNSILPYVTEKGFTPNVEKDKVDENGRKLSEIQLKKREREGTK